VDNVGYQFRGMTALSEEWLRLLVAMPLDFVVAIEHRVYIIRLHLESSYYIVT
jgi:hypothetical protein